MTRDEPRQSEQVNRFLERQGQARPAFVNLVVLIETVWVLSRAKQLASHEVRKMLAVLLNSPHFALQESALVAEAVEISETANCDFANALIAALNAHAGCSTTVTFDRNAQRLPGMSAVPAK